MNRAALAAHNGIAESDARTRVVPRIALTPAEAAESIGCSAEFFREHVDGELRWIRRGRKRFVPLVELERWAETNSETTL